MTNEFKKYIKRVSRDNKHLQDASTQKKRVMIARDVIAAIQTKRVIPKCGVWMTGRVPDDRINVVNKTSSMQKVLRNIPQCSVCALGACFVTAIDRFSGISKAAAGIHEIDKDDDDISLNVNHVENALTDYFYEDQMTLIENAFETKSGGTEYAPGKDGIRARNFGRRREDVKERMIDIMQNIIDNNGMFIPPGKFDDPKSKCFNALIAKKKSR